MAASLGYVLMNWTAEFARHSKAKKANKKKEKDNKDKNRDAKQNKDKKREETLAKAFTAAVQTEGKHFL